MARWWHKYGQNRGENEENDGQLEENDTKKPPGGERMTEPGITSIRCQISTQKRFNKLPLKTMDGRECTTADQKLNRLCEILEIYQNRELRLRYERRKGKQAVIYY